ncbi:MAG: hypothetical protein ACOC2W_01950 [bacterium]
MKTRIFIFTLIMVLFISISVAAEGFKDIKWGDTIEYLENEKDMSFQRVESLESTNVDASDYGLKYYTRENDDYNLGSIPMETIVYGTFNGKICSIAMYTEGDDLIGQIVRMFNIKYGDYNDKEELFMETIYQWNKNKIFSQVTEEEGFTEETTVTIFIADTNILLELSTWQEEQRTKQAEINAESW